VADRATSISGGDQATFQKVRVLEEAMGRVSEVRSELIERVKQFVGNPSYPPNQTIQQIAILLAISLPRGIEREYRGGEGSHSE
jgi:hypothetical protein